DKAPKVVPDGAGGGAWQFRPDTPPAPIGIYASAGRKHEDVRWTGVTFAAANQGNSRAEPRLQEQDVDGVDAEVLFGSARMMSHFFSDPDPEFHLAGVQAYNDWIAEEFVKVAPERLIGLTCIPALGVDAAIKEMERGRRLGLDPLHPRAARRPLVAEPVVATRQAEARAELLLPPQLALDLHDRPLRRPEPPHARRREHDVVERLPAPRLRLAGDPARRGRHVPRRERRRAPPHLRAQRGRALQARLTRRGDQLPSRPETCVSGRDRKRASVRRSVDDANVMPRPAKPARHNVAG